MLLFVLWVGRGSNSSQVSAGMALSKPTQHFPAMDVQRECAHVLRAPVPDEMGKYDCFPLGNAFFYSLIKALFYLCRLLCSCACGNLTFHVQTQTVEGNMGRTQREPPFFRHGTSQAVGMLPCCFSRTAPTGEFLLGAVI